MSSPVSTERIFSLSCFEGLRLIRKYKIGHPELQLAELIGLVEKVEADALSLDLEASGYLSELVDAECPLDGQEFYQHCIKAVLLKHQPLWAKLMRQGRSRFVKKLDANDQDIFAAAGLMINPTPLEVVTWWDSVSGFARLFSDQEKMEQGRAAELLSLKHEKERLQKLGISKEPEWPGFDDNFAGFDVLSFDKNEYGLINRLIEVKSTTLSPMRFIVTRHEWSKAKKAGDAYLFHVWDMKQEPPVLHIRTVEQVEPHIPENQGKGAWTLADIPMSV